MPADANRTVTIQPRSARRFSDPVFGESLQMQRHVMFIPVRDIPLDLPTDPNPRDVNINRVVYKDVQKSLLNEEGQENTFHLKHKGITVLCDRIEKVADKPETYEIVFAPGQGVVDGGHSYALIKQALADDTLPASQYVKLEFLTHVPEDWIAEIAGGLNTSVQVQDMSLDNLEGMFDWLKDLLKDEPYYDLIAWKENQKRPVDARELISMLYCFNMLSFPNDGEKHPTEAYSSKSAVLKHYERNIEQYQKLAPIVKDILALSDTISCTAVPLYNKDTRGKGGALHFIETAGRKPFDFTFLGKSAEYRMMSSALLPMLAAFRWLAVYDPDTDTVVWKNGYDSVNGLWQEMAPELMRLTAQAGNDLGRNLNALGKSGNHWGNLHARVAVRYMMSHRNH